jgi:hypothetical protein
MRGKQLGQENESKQFKSLGTTSVVTRSIHIKLTFTTWFHVEEAKLNVIKAKIFPIWCSYM